MRSRPLVAEFVGTAFLLAAVVGSGIMGERLANGNSAVALLANTVATGAALVALILTFGPISGAHFNPAVSVADASQGGLSWSQAGGYVVAQIVGALIGVALADAMFGEPVYAWSQHARKRISPNPQRDSRHVWSALGDLGMCPATTRRGGVCRGRVHHGRLLVHGIDVIRQPCSDARSRTDEHVCGDSARRRARFSARTDGRCGGGDGPLSLVGANPSCRG